MLKLIFEGGRFLGVGRVGLRGRNSILGGGINICKGTGVRETGTISCMERVQKTRSLFIYHTYAAKVQYTQIVFFRASSKPQLTYLLTCFGKLKVSTATTGMIPESSQASVQWGGTI